MHVNLVAFDWAREAWRCAAEHHQYFFDLPRRSMNARAVIQVSIAWLSQLVVQAEHVFFPVR